MNSGEEKKVLIGKDGWLFLDNDTNNSPGQFRGDVNLSPEFLKQYEIYFDRIIEKISCDFCFIIAPNKEYVLPDNYPHKIRSSGIDKKLIHEQVIELLIAKKIKYSYPIDLLSSFDKTYYKTDSHWSDFGAYLALNEAMQKCFKTQLVSLEAEDFLTEYVAGDLGSKLETCQLDARLIYGYNVKTNLIFNSQITNHGYVDHLINDKAINNEKVLVFGDSFGFQFLNPLIMSFREVIFVYLPAAFIEEIYDLFKPDKVVFEINQRFLLDPPVYRLSAKESLMFKKIKRMSIEEIENYKSKISGDREKSFLADLYYQGILSLQASKQPNRQIIFSGKEVEVVSNLVSNGGNSIVVTFTSRSDTPQKSGFGEQFFLKKGISAIHFISKNNHWWQIDEMNDAIKSALPMLKGYKNICTYGASMGGHGALVFSGMLGATSVIAGSPQYAINGRLVPWTPRWARDTKDVSEKFPIEQNCSTSATIYCIYDPFENLDRTHIQALEGIRKIIKIHTPFSGHSAVLHLQSNGLLSRLVSEIVSCSFDCYSYRNQLKKKRHNNIKYLFGLASYASKRGSRQSIATWSYQKASEMAINAVFKQEKDIPHMDILPILKKHCKTLVHQKNSKEALELAQLYCRTYPDIVFSHELLCDVYWKMKDFKSALTEAQRALRLNRQNPSLRLLVGRLHLMLGQIEEAQYHFATSLSFQSKDKKAWLAALEDINRMGLVDYKIKNNIINRIKDIDPNFIGF